MAAISRSMHRAMQAIYTRCTLSTSAGTTNDRLDKVNALFAEARLLLQEYVRLPIGPSAPLPKRSNTPDQNSNRQRRPSRSANEAFGTTYFEEDFEDAKLATNETLSAFQQLIDSLSPSERSRVLAANRPKMAQLEEELKVLTDSLIHDDH